jgi:FMN-binding domain
MRLAPVLATTLTALTASTSGWSETYLTTEQAQAALFPGATFTARPLSLDAEQVKLVSTQSGIRLRSPDVKVWSVSTGGWFFVDEVLGKHEFITFAVGLDAAGAVSGVEILVYKESYGQQVRNAPWRAQFTGKTAAAPLKLDVDIQNISGATLSSRHVMEGVKRILAIHALALAAPHASASP